MRPLSRWGSRALHRLVPHTVRRHLRAPSVSWVVAVVVGVSTAAFTFQLVDRAEAGAARYGAPVTVIVAAVDLPAGHVIVDDDVRAVRLPRAAVPPDHLRAGAVGRALRHAVDEGQVVTERSVGRRGRSAVAAALAPGTRAVAVPRGDHPIPLRAGDHVDVLAPDADGVLTPVAESADVIEVDDDVATLAIEEELVGDVAAGALAGTVAMVVTG
jgi:Flp pilus assembly protein CpaB